MAYRLDIFIATYSKYRRIIKLSYDLLDPIVRFLEEKRITFEVTYIISNMCDFDIRIL